MSDSSEASFPSIETLLPHRGAMALLSGLLAADAQGWRAAARVDAGWPGVQGGRVDSVVAVELVAQAAAAWLAWRDRAEAAARAGTGRDGVSGGELAGQEPVQGMLVGVQEVALHAGVLRVGDLLEMAVRPVWARGPLVQVCGVVRRDRQSEAARDRVSEETREIVAEVTVELVRGRAPGEPLGAGTAGEATAGGRVRP